jgi:hypothetical protein
MKTAARQITEPAAARAAPAVIQLGPLPDLAPSRTRHGSEKRQRSAGILVKLTPADHERVKTEAAAAGMSAAGYLASGRLGEEAARRPRVSRRRAPVDEKALMTALVAFNRANNNLNQVAHTGNAMMLFAEEHGCERLKELGADLVRAAENLRDDFAAPIAAILAAVADVPQG